MEKAKMIKYAKIGGGILAAVVAITLGYRWYKNRQLAKENAAPVGGDSAKPAASSAASVAPASTSSAPSTVATNVPAATAPVVDDLSNAVAFVMTETARLIKDNGYWGGKIKVEATAKGIGLEKAAVNILYSTWVANKQIPSTITKDALLTAIKS